MIRLAPESSAGSSLIGLLVALLVLAGLGVAIPLMTAGASSTPKATTSSTTLPSSSPLAAGANIDAATVAACQADYAAAETAVSAYQVQTGSLPANTAQLQPYLRDSLTNAEFSIIVDPHHAGRLEVMIPGHTATDGAGGCKE